MFETVKSFFKTNENDFIFDWQKEKVLKEQEDLESLVDYAKELEEEKRQKKLQDIAAQITIKKAPLMPGANCSGVIMPMYLKNYTCNCSG